MTLKQEIKKLKETPKMSLSETSLDPSIVSSLKKLEITNVLELMMSNKNLSLPAFQKKALHLWRQDRNI